MIEKPKPYLIFVNKDKMDFFTNKYKALQDFFNW